MIIEFRSVDEMAFEVSEKPYPASKLIPDWWKNSQSSFIHPSDKNSNVSTFKRCMPILDVLSAGYIIPLHADIEVISNKDNAIVKWSYYRPVVEQHLEEKVNGIEVPDGYSESIFKYLNSWIIKTPPGYSALITHPFGYKNLPFYSYSGIVDSDTYHGEINTPFSLKKDFSGLILKGTPMMQVIPFKREDWKSEITKGTGFETYKVGNILTTKMHSGYKKIFRKPKSYL
jgi:hypothetical protein